MPEFRGNRSKPTEFFVHDDDWMAAITYRAYSGPRGSESIAPLEKDRLLYKEFDTLDAALAWSRHVNDGGRVALLIEGDDGTHLGKQEIAGALHHREAPPR